MSSSSKNDLSENYLTYLTEHTGLQREQVIFQREIFKPCSTLKVLDYYTKFKKTGDPLKAPIDQTEFYEIMQVSVLTTMVVAKSLVKLNRKNIKKLQTGVLPPDLPSGSC